MAGTVIGGQNAAAANKAKYGEDFYEVIGRRGGLAPKTRPGGFGADRELARRAGTKGGMISSMNKLSVRERKARRKAAEATYRHLVAVRAEYLQQQADQGGHAA